MTPAMTPVAHPDAAAARAARAKVTVGGVLRAVWRAVSNRFAVRPLLDMDDRMLADIGLARGDVHAALSTGLASDPSSRLAVTAASHAQAEQARLRATLRSHALVKGTALQAGAAPRRDLAA